MIKSHANSSQSGITLVEVMVSLFLFGIALSSLMYLLTTVLTNADELRNNTIAAGLAQEGLEVVRNIRDQDWIITPVGCSTPPNCFGTSIGDGQWEAQWNSDSLTAYSAPGRYLQKDSSTGLFNYTTGTTTRFKRMIQISTVNSHEKIVAITVTWQSNNGGTSTTTAESHLYDWK